MRQIEPFFERTPFLKKPAAIGLVIVLGVLSILIGAREPRYQTKTLSWWLQQCSDTALTNLVRAGTQNESSAALKALAAIAPTQALPVLSNVVLNGSSTTLGAALASLKTIAPELALKMTQMT